MRKILLSLLLFIPAVAFALTYDASHLPYSDAPAERRTAVAVSTLTEEGILQGYPDGTFRPQALVNRAEFLKIAMKLAPDIPPASDTACFPDIDPSAWYASFVCAAKRDGIVNGDALDGIDSSRWRFHPDRTVNYAEALKMLFEVLHIRLLDADYTVWYVPYVSMAEAEHIGLPDARADQQLRRGEVAELAASFLAYNRGELSLLRAAQSGQASSESSVSSASSVSWVSCPESYRCSVAAPGTSLIPEAPCRFGSEFFGACGDASKTGVCYRCAGGSSSSSSQSSNTSTAYDPLTDYSTLPEIFRLGTTTNILGAVKIFNNLEPFLVEDITVTFTGSVPSVDQVRMYASADGRYLGGASRDSANPASFKLHLASGILTAPKSTEVSVYARSLLSSFTAGGVSGETIRVSTFKIEGAGGWSNKRYSQTSTETFSTSETARSNFTSIANAGSATETLIAGTQRALGSFRFTGVTGDGNAQLRILGLEIEAGLSGGVTLSNIKLGVNGSSDRFDCSIAGSTITCASLSDTFGVIGNGSRTLTVYGDIALSSGSSHGGVQLSLTPAGTISSSGAITWTDGTSIFQWVPFDETTLHGTHYSN